MQLIQKKGFSQNRLHRRMAKALPPASELNVKKDELIRARRRLVKVSRVPSYSNHGYGRNYVFNSVYSLFLAIFVVPFHNYFNISKKLPLVPFWVAIL